jgi:hypothetical protein
MIGRRAVAVATGRAVTCAAITCLAAGCGQSTNPRIWPPPGREPPPPPLWAFQRAFEAAAQSQYDALFTDDFRFRFSVQSDPALDVMYGTNWTVDDESQAVRHLFDGYVDAEGTHHPPASGITVGFVNDQYFPDPEHADSAAQYLYAPVTAAHLTVDVPGDSERVLHYVASAPESFWLVRGDVAHLREGQPPDSTRWYIRAWQEQAPAADSAQAGTGGVIPTTWGRLRASYR